MFVYIILAIFAIVAVVWLYNWVLDCFHKSKAEKIMKKYPNAVKGVFGYYHEVSLKSKNDINCFVAPAHTEDFWKSKEKEECERLNRCNTLKSSYPNGWESWKQLHPKQFEDLHIVDKESDSIRSLEEQYGRFRNLDQWCHVQESITSKANLHNGYSLVCSINGIDRFGNAKLFDFSVAHLFIKYEKCKSSNVEVANDQYSFVETILSCAKQINENIVCLTLPACDSYKYHIESIGIQTLPISIVTDFAWNKYQVFALLTDIADQQEIKYICEVLLSNMDSCPLIIAFSLVKTISDTEYNVQHYRAYSSTHNTDNAYFVDKLLELHPNEGAYYFTVKEQICRSVKKAISMYFKPFDTDLIAKRTSNKYRHSYSSQYYNKSADEIKQMWANKRDESARYSRKLREDIMTILSNMPCDRDETSRHFDTFNKEWKISPYRTNWPIYDRESGLVAIVDCLAYQEDKFILFSWVRTDSALEDHLFALQHFIQKYVVDDLSKKSFIKSYYDDGLLGMAFEHLSDCKFTKYSIEQYVIMYILQKDYGITIDESYIVIMHPKYKLPIAFRPDDVSKEVEMFMINENMNNKTKPSIKKEFGITASPIVHQDDVESIDLIELF